jgi:hypothetical protein
MYADVSLLNIESSNASYFSMIIEAHQAMDQIASPSELYTWYQIDAPYGKLFVSMFSTQIILQASSNTTNDNFPSVSSTRLTFKLPFVAGTKIAILSADPDALTKAQKVLRQVGVDSKLLSKKTFFRNGVAFDLLFIEISSGTV